MSIRLEMTFDTVEEMLAVFTAKILPTTAAAMELPVPAVKEEPKKAAPKPKAEKPAVTPAASETATTETTPAASAPSAPATESPSDTGVKITLEFVRSKLAELSQAGKTAQVKALLADFGASSLSAVPAEKYADLLNKAAKL